MLICIIENDELLITHRLQHNFDGSGQLVEFGKTSGGIGEVDPCICIKAGRQLKVRFSL